MRFKTIEAMEDFAKYEEDYTANTKIRGEYLEVVLTSVEGDFEYFWGKNQVSREVAERVLKTSW